MELIGRRFGHIRVTHAVGQGGMGDVYAGFDDKLERKVALKVLQPDQRLDEEARERLLREARALSRLDHPNICRIHDYIESGDVDLLVLEFIDGRTLQDVLQEGLSRGEKLRIAIAVAEVLVAAHRTGIVHRDLKPENVMLTKSGEVKVLDFGLARWLKGAARSRSSDRFQAIRLPVRSGNGGAERSDMTVIMPAEELDDSPSPSRRPDLATAVGITLGTPLYMSPEQARGEILTPASDMFAFGLLLQTLFTGEDPHPPDLTAREVILRVARGQTRPVTGTPGDVTALINSLKQIAPADRPTAVEAVRRLRYLADKPHRIARRALAAAVVAVLLIGAWRYTVDLRRERATAVAARAQAGSLVRFMLVDLREKLEPVGRLEILDNVAERSLTYLGSLRAEELTPAEIINTVDALNQLGQVRILRGNLGEADAAFQRSLVLAQKVAAAQPQNTDALKALSSTHFWQGSLAQTRSDLPTALRHFREHLRIAEEASNRDPGNADWQLERAQGHANVGSVLEAQGDLEGAMNQYEKSVEAKRRLTAGKPGDAEMQAELANTLNKVGVAQHKLGYFARARNTLEREIAIHELLLRQDPKNATWATRHANARAFLAVVLEDVGEIDAAFRHRQVELETNRQLVTLDPENMRWKRNLAITQNRFGSLMRMKGDFASARAMQRAAQKLMTEVLQTAPTRAAWRRDRAWIHMAYARTLTAAGDAEAARAAAAQAVTDATEAQDRTVPSKVVLADAYVASAEAARGAGDERAASESAGEAIAILQGIARGSAATPRAQALLATALDVRGRGDEARPIYASLIRSGYFHPDCHGCRERGL